MDTLKIRRAQIIECPAGSHFLERIRQQTRIMELMFRSDSAESDFRFEKLALRVSGKPIQVVGSSFGGGMVTGRSKLRLEVASRTSCGDVG
jgi:hypothetical protein